jgi:intracellular multiplication protein IcmE
MTNNLEDFEQPGMEPGNGLPPPGSGVRANLTHAWRTRPLFKLMVLMIVAAAVIVIAMSLFSSSNKTEITKLAAPPGGLHQAPGGATSPYFNEQVNKADAERVNKALSNGTDAMPTPVGGTNSVDDMTAAKQKPDPLVELRAQIELQKQKIAQIEQRPQQQQQQPAPQPKPEPFDDSLAQAMQKQMQQLETAWEPKGIKEVGGAQEDKSKNGDNANGANGQGYGDYGTGTAANKKFAVPIISAGTVSYAQLLTEANSDVPGPILAQILSGPLTGARAIGEFKVENDYLVLKFSLATLKGIDYPINALALDPDTTLGGMATEVDERWLTRVLLPAAAGFMQGFGSALGQGNSSIVTSGDTTIISQSGRSVTQGLYTGLAQAGQTMGQFFQNEANNTKPLIVVAAGTPMGLFFTQTVCSGQGCPLPENNQQSRAAAATTSGMAGNMGTYTPYVPFAGNNPYGGTPGLSQSYGTGVNTNMGTNGFSGGGFGTNTTGFGNNNNQSSGQIYNTSNPPTPVSQQNNGLNTITGSPGLGTTVFNP